MRAAERLIRAIVVLEILWLVLACVLTPWRADLPLAVVLRPYLLPAIGAAVLIASLLISTKAQALLVLCTVPAALVLLPLELALGSTSRRLDRAFQRASQVPVLHASGLDVFPILAPWDLAYGHRVLATAHGDALPLTGLSNRHTALCQLNGSELVFQSDSLGLRNANAAMGTEPDIALIGDSFAQGYCVDDSASIAGNLARLHTVQNFGVTGAGPVWELGVLREYVARTRPRVIVWAFFEGNDLEGADAESSGFAARYLEPAFTQNLANRRAEIEHALMVRLDSLADAFDQKPLERLRQLVLLREIRARLALSIRPPEAALARSGSPVDDALPVLRKVLSMAKNEAATWGGSIVFVYLPERDRFTTAMRSVRESSVGGHYSAHPRVIEIASSLGMSVIDMSPAFSAQPAPLDLFDEGGVHYNAIGYKLVSDSIDSFLGRATRLAAPPTLAVEREAADRWIKFTPLSKASIVRPTELQ